LAAEHLALDRAVLLQRRHVLVVHERRARAPVLRAETAAVPPATPQPLADHLRLPNPQGQRASSTRPASRDRDGELPGTADRLSVFPSRRCSSSCPSASPARSSSSSSSRSSSTSSLSTISTGSSPSVSAPLRSATSGLLPFGVLPAFVHWGACREQAPA